MTKFDKNNYDAMQLGAAVKGLLHDKNADKRANVNEFIEWVRGAIEEGCVPEPDKSAFLKKYGSTDKKKSSTRDKVVAKVKKSRGK